MEQKISIFLKQSQKMKFSQEMKLGLKILSLPILELNQFINQKIEENPLLEKIEDFSIEKNFSSISNFYENYQNIAQKDSLYTKLIKQAKISFNKRDLEIAFFIIGNLNKKGFLEESSQEISTQLKTTNKKVLEVIEKIKQLDPIGSGSKNLKDFFLTQIKETNIKILKIAETYFDNFLKTKNSLKIFKLLKKMKNLKFSVYNSEEENINIYPDIIIKYKNKKWEVIINKITTFQINKKYKNLLKIPLNSEEKKTVKNFLHKATFLKTTIEKRKDTLEKVAFFLIKFQKNFLLEKKELKPFTISKASSFFNIKISTLSRAISNKYIKAPCGFLKLKDLFSHEIKGEKKISSKELKKILLLLIKKEDKKNPLSDEKISKILAKKGILCSRRTVTKYRNKLFILSKNKRKAF